MNQLNRSFRQSKIVILPWWRIDIKSSSCRNKQKLRLQYFIIRSNGTGLQLTQRHRRIDLKRTAHIHRDQKLVIYSNLANKNEFLQSKMKDKYCLIDYFLQEDFPCREGQANARYLLGMFLNFLDPYIWILITYLKVFLVIGDNFAIVG